ncbi:ABC transporter substrate-binding protein [Altererythrobacter sp.]|uniref:ABC transporter substrate-binding protein n=1 Tax=Altererythrobacter sp. TaxID=1872480 RepID=UPI003D147907
MALPRVVSLLPSATEIAVELGVGERLVGRSHECDFPPWVARLPVCTSTKLEKGLDSRAIEDRVRAIVTAGLSVYDVDADLLRSLEPDVILTQSQCAICAVTPADLEDALNAWVGTRPVLVSTAPDDLSDVFRDFATVGAAIGEEQAAEALIRRSMEGLAELAAPVPQDPPVRMLAIEWIDPLMVAGNWVPELIAAAGVESLLANPGVHSHAIDTEAAYSSDPDIIVMMPCGYRIEQTLAESRPLLQREPWRSMRAVREGRAFAVDGHHLFNRPGPRLLQSARLLAALLRQPENMPEWASGLYERI